MQRFSVTVRAASGPIHYSAIARRSIDVVSDAIEMFGVCSLFVRLA